jgi:hypothetical protein
VERENYIDYGIITARSSTNTPYIVITISEIINIATPLLLLKNVFKKI